MAPRFLLSVRNPGFLQTIHKPLRRPPPRSCPLSLAPPTARAAFPSAKSRQAPIPSSSTRPSAATSTPSARVTEAPPPKPTTPEVSPSHADGAILPRPTVKPALATIACTLILSTAAPSRGAPREVSDWEADSQALFEEGRRLLAAGQLEASCRKFEEL